MVIRQSKSYLKSPEYYVTLGHISPDILRELILYFLENNINEKGSAEMVDHMVLSSRKLQRRYQLTCLGCLYKASDITTTIIIINKWKNRSYNGFIIFLCSSCKLQINIKGLFIH